MKVATWNVRGFNKLHKHKEMMRIVNKEKVVVMAITEHRVTEQKAPSIIKKVDINFAFTAIYGLHTIDDRKILWQDIQRLEPNIQQPWLVMGDFKAVLKHNDRMGGSPIQDAEVADFEQLLDTTSLTVMKTVGRFYTWTNSHVHSRIDRGLVNAEWMNLWPHLEVEATDPYFSDHSMLCVTFASDQRRSARPFRFLNHLTTHTDFHEVVKQVWDTPMQGSHMTLIWNKLKLMKEEMKKMNHQEFSNVEQRIQSYRQQLSEVQEQLRDCFSDPTLYATEKEIKLSLEKWILVEESILRQKSRVQWLKLGDTNSKIFPCLSQE
ncbi:uncharacterized protein LOC132053823 [Lycium ferocissimum]|uniref:uncharacterized protein LOC132053823 n=1 Tax=Lycium ferocissimum TaxID=112874 RepID=UPI002815D219|nr:uncharacterized protein LOC132053823 [Lycium ferocissimum]